MLEQRSLRVSIVATLEEASSFEIFIHRATMIVQTRFFGRRNVNAVYDEDVHKVLDAATEKFKLNLGDRFVVSLLGDSMEAQYKERLRAAHLKMITFAPMLSSVRPAQINP